MATGLSALVLGAAMVVGQVPLSVPPQPVDDALMRAAPEECVLFVSSAGMAAPDPNSDNRTERFLADPDVQAFTSHAGRLVEALLDDTLGELDESGLPLPLSNPSAADATNIAPELRPFLRLLLTEPWIAYAGPIEGTLQGTGFPNGALVVRSDEPDVTRRQVANLIEARMKLPEATDALFEIIGEAAEEGFQIKTTYEENTVEFAIACRGPYLVLAYGEDELDAVFERLETPTPEWLRAALDSLDIDRPSMIVHMSVADILKSPQLNLLLAMMENPIEKYDLSNLESVCLASGLDEGEHVSRIQVNMDGGPQGIWKDILSGSIDQNDLAIVPSDALLAGAIALPDGWCKIDDDGTLHLFGQAINDDDEEEDEQTEVEAAIEKLMIEIMGELSDSFGETWVLFQSQSENGLIPYNMTIANRLRDPDAFEATIKKLLLALTGQTFLGGENVPRYQKNEVAGTAVHTLSFDTEGVDFNIGLSWCVIDGTLYASISTPALKSIILRDESFKPLAEDERVALLFEGDAPPTAVGYVDPVLLFDLLYGLAPYLQGYAEGAIANSETPLERTREVGLPATIWPATTTIRKHCVPCIASLRTTDDGVRAEVRKVIPCGPVELYIQMNALAAVFGGGIGQIQPAYTTVPDEANNSFIAPVNTAGEEVGGAYASYGSGYGSDYRADNNDEEGYGASSPEPAHDGSAYRVYRLNK